MTRSPCMRRAPFRITALLAHRPLADRESNPDITGMKSRHETAVKAGTKRRRCLMCGRDFPSEGTYNRICKKCKSSQAWRDRPHSHRVVDGG